MNTLGLSAHEYMARQVNFTQGLRLPSNHYLFKNVRSIPTTGGRDTVVQIAPNKLNGARFHGSREFKYWRTNLSEFNGHEYIIPAGYVPATRGHLLQFVNAQLGLTLTVDDIVDAPITGFTTPFNITFTANTTSLLYKGTFTATFTYSLEQLLPIRILDGFVYPTAQTAAAPTETISAYLTNASDLYLSYGTQKNDEALIWIAPAFLSLENKYEIDFGAVLYDTQRVTSLLNDYRITLTIDRTDDAMDQKFFLKAANSTFTEPMWRTAFDDATMPMNSVSELPSLARGKLIIPKTNELVKITITAKPLRVIWMPEIVLTVTV